MNSGVKLPNRDQRIATIKVQDMSNDAYDKISEHESESAKSATTESVSLDSDNELEGVEDQKRKLRRQKT